MRWAHLSFIFLAVVQVINCVCLLSDWVINSHFCQCPHCFSVFLLLSCNYKRANKILMIMLRVIPMAVNNWRVAGVRGTEQRLLTSHSLMDTSTKQLLPLLKLD